VGNGHHLTVDHGRLGRQLVQQLRDGRETLGEVVPIAAVMITREPTL
jgi:hypothetical protein